MGAITWLALGAGLIRWIHRWSPLYIVRNYQRRGFTSWMEQWLRLLCKSLQDWQCIERPWKGPVQLLCQGPTCLAWHIRHVDFHVQNYMQINSKMWDQDLCKTALTWQAQWSEGSCWIQWEQCRPRSTTTQFPPQSSCPLFSLSLSYTFTFFSFSQSTSTLSPPWQHMCLTFHWFLFKTWGSHVKEGLMRHLHLLQQDVFETAVR